MKKIIMFLVLVILVVGAAVGTLFFLELGPFEKKQEDAAEVEEPEEFTDDTSNITIKPFTIPMFQGERISGSIKVQFELEVMKGQEEAVNEQMRRLEDAYLRDLYVFLPRLVRNTETLDIVALKRRLMRVTERIVGPDIVDDILIQSVADAPG